MKGKCVYYFDEPACEGWYWYLLPEGKENKIENLEMLFPEDEIVLSSNRFVYYKGKIDETICGNLEFSPEIDPKIWVACFDFGANIEIISRGQ